MTTTIDFLLPNQRVELMQCGSAWVANRLMATPVSEMECRIDFSAYWFGLHWLPFGNLIFRTLTKMFLSQDERAMKHLAVGLRHKPSSMFLGTLICRLDGTTSSRPPILNRFRPGVPLTTRSKNKSRFTGEAELISYKRPDSAESLKLSVRLIREDEFRRATNLIA